MLKRVTPSDNWVTPFNRTTIGFDRLLDVLESQMSTNQSTYPPYNICQINENEYIITIAVAGFTMDDLEVTCFKNTLKISGTSSVKQDESITYLHKGIGGRSFTREFTLADHIEVKSARLESGLLNIELIRTVPEEMLPKQIKIN